MVAIGLDVTPDVQDEVSVVRVVTDDGTLAASSLKFKMLVVVVVRQAAERDQLLRVYKVEPTLEWRLA